jgi:hypothetical protein
VEYDHIRALTVEVEMILSDDEIAFPRIPFAVIDQSCLRDSKAISAAIGEGRQILLPDTAFAEMTKGNVWTLPKSLQVLAQYHDRIAVSHATGELMRREKQCGKPISDIVDYESTSSLQVSVREIAWADGLAMSALQKAVPAAKHAAASQQLNVERNRRILSRFVTFWKTRPSDYGLGTLRRGDDDSFRQLLGGTWMTQTIANGLVGAGYEASVAKHLAAEPSVCAHTCIAIAASGLNWVKEGGIDSLRDDRFNNELCDIDYLVAASFCEQLMTKDHKMAQLHEHICHIVDLRWATFPACDKDSPTGLA